MWSTHVVNAFIVKTREYKKSTKTIRHDDAIFLERGLTGISENKSLGKAAYHLS